MPSDLPPQSVIFNNTNQSGGTNIGIQNNIGDQVLHLQDWQKKFFRDELANIKGKENPPLLVEYGAAMGGADPIFEEIYETIIGALDGKDVTITGETGVGLTRLKLNVVVYIDRQQFSYPPPLALALLKAFLEAKIPVRCETVLNLPPDKKNKIVVSMTVPPPKDPAK